MKDGRELSTASDSTVARALCRTIPLLARPSNKNFRNLCFNQPTSFISLLRIGVFEKRFEKRCNTAVCNDLHIWEMRRTNGELSGFFRCNTLRTSALSTTSITLMKVCLFSELYNACELQHEVLANYVNALTDQHQEFQSSIPVCHCGKTPQDSQARVPRFLQLHGGQDDCLVQGNIFSMR